MKSSVRVRTFSFTAMRTSQKVGRATPCTRPAACPAACVSRVYKASGPGATKPDVVDTVLREVVVTIRAGGVVMEVDPRAAPPHPPLLLSRPKARGPLPNISRHVLTPVYTAA